MTTNSSDIDTQDLPSPWSIGVDVGGTFTDLVLRDAAGAAHVTKVPSVPGNPSAGVMHALNAAAAGFAMTLADLLAGCALFVHGSTVATNTILERKGARIGMLTTAGFRDSLEIRRGIRANQWDHRAPFPEVLAPRYLRRPIEQRTDKDGAEATALNSQDIAAAAEIFRAEEVEAVAICFLNSYLNGAHEAAAAEALKQHLPDLHITQSHAVAPIMGEYERSSTAAMNAYVSPLVVSYLGALDRALAENGLARPILMLQSNGGAISIQQVAQTPVNLLLSGPAAGVGALNLTARQIGHDSLIAMEIGGTSCDVTLMHEGVVPVTEELTIDGYHLGTPSVDIHTVGAGGGTVAWIDAAGMLRVGPHGAGANPGPACYGLGGAQATATDAQLVLGRMRPGPYAGGAVTLDREKAIAAIKDTIAGPLNISVEAAAIGILQLLEQNLLHAVEQISIERGYDPKNFVLVAAGGAGPMHGTSVAEALGCGQVYVPRQAGAFCAIGMLNSDVRQDILQVHLADFHASAVTNLEVAYKDLSRQAGEFLAQEGFQNTAARQIRELDLRYRSQLWSIRVTLADGDLDLDAIRRSFEAQHERMFGHIQPDGNIEITAARIIAYGLIERSAVELLAATPVVPEAIATAPVYLDDQHGWLDTPRYRGGDLKPGTKLTGPLLIDEETTTVFVGQGDQLTVDQSDNFLIQLSRGTT